jgi:hypothetical protein
MVEIGGMPILWHIMKIYGHDEPVDGIRRSRRNAIPDEAPTNDQRGLKRP